MSGLSRRDLIGGVAMGSLLLSADAVAGGTPEPSFGPAPPPLAGPELPSFRFPLGSLPTKTFNGGTAKEATVAEFPVSEKLAGVYMTLEPGGLRELHWHANAAE
jgi:oxalate decarboxylase